MTALALFASLAAASRPASFRTPLERDTGQYLYIGHTILHGGTPYVDAANNKGPVTFLVFALVRLVSGHSVVLLRLTLLVFAAVAAFAVASYVERAAGRAAGLLAGGLFAVLGSTTFLQGDDPNTEQYGVAPMAAAWWIATRGTLRSSAAAGALAAAAVLMNTGFVAVIPIVLYELLTAQAAVARRVRIMAAIGGGLALALVVFAWLGASGALDDMRLQVLKQATDAVNGSIPGHLNGIKVNDRLSPRALLEVPIGALWIAGLVGSLAAASDRRLRPVAIGAALWILAMWARTKLSSYTFVHHYYPAMPGIAAGIALGIEWALSPLSWRRVPAVAMVLTVPVWAYVVGPEWRLLDVRASDRWGSGSSFSLAYPVADFIRGHTRSGDKVMVAGAEPEVYWLAGREAPTRFFDVFPIYWRPAYAAERQAKLLRFPPTAIASIGAGAGPLDADLQKVLDRYRYRLAYAKNGARVWLRASSP